MTKTFLLEVGLEEIPAHVVTPSAKQLVKRVSDYLKDQRVDFESIKSYATPRRLAIMIHGLAEKQPDVSAEAKGPSKKIALDAEGNWSKAAIGFTRGQGATTDDIEFKEVKGEEYVFVKTFTAGQPVESVLQGLDDVIKAMTFPTMMHWGFNSFEFVRPIKWLVALLDDEVIPFSILDVTTGRETNGHRFLGHPVELTSANDYEEALTKEFVVADADKRKKEIRTQIERIAQAHSWTIDVDEDLLEEVNNLVEWPTAFTGSFDDKYLTIPDEVLITSMKDHQRFFYVQDEKGALLPNFVSVRNGTDHDIQNVVAGNEKVLTARLEDAMFFYQEDQKKSIDDFVERLKTVTFHDKIGTMAEKMARVHVISDVMASHIGLNDESTQALNRAADIYKFDLLTGMVGEFAELQGVMGEKYALLKGEKPETATAIREHYMPISADGALPSSKVGSVLAVADKLDTILTFFAAGMIPSGSNDPYALRRQATGIARITRENRAHLPIKALIDEVVAAELSAGVAPNHLDQLTHTNDVVAFLKDRVAQSLHQEKVRHDISDAVVKGVDDDLYDLFTAADVLSHHADDDNFKSVIEALTRVLRIAEKNDDDLTNVTVDPALFENASEGALHDAVATFKASMVNSGDLETRYVELAALQPVIANYFDETMVMAENETVRQNRLAELSQLAKETLPLGNLNELIVK